MQTSRHRNIEYSCYVYLIYQCQFKHRTYSQMNISLWVSQVTQEQLNGRVHVYVGGGSWVPFESALSFAVHQDLPEAVRLLLIAGAGTKNICIRYTTHNARRILLYLFEYAPSFTTARSCYIHSISRGCIQTAQVLSTFGAPVSQGDLMFIGYYVGPLYWWAPIIKSFFHSFKRQHHKFK